MLPQLGVIKVKKKLAKTRFDYVVLQLYLHKLIKTHPQGDLRYTYNNYINSKEFREDYNNQSSNHLVASITKLLDDTVYNENSNAICYYKISRKMVSEITKKLDYADVNYYNDLFINKTSTLNQVHTHKRDYIQSQILKLTFPSEQRQKSDALLRALEKISNTRVGYYDRTSGEQTILVSIKKNCDTDTKRFAAYKIMKCAINHLRKIPSLSSIDKRYLLTVKFFLFYMFDENPVVIKPTISRNVCVICTRGKNNRVQKIQSLLDNSIANEDEEHEIEFLLSQIKDDTINDTSIMIPASILVYQKNAIGRKLSEFDGMVIHPLRKENQVIFLEAKNRGNQPSFGKKCLMGKFDKFSFKYVSNDIKIIDHDAYWKYTLK